MKVKVVQNDFSGGVTGKTGQYKDKELNTIQNSRNLVAGRSKSLRTIPGVTETPLNILPTDKYLNFTFKGRVYHLVYDTLCKSRWLGQSRANPIHGDGIALGGLSGNNDVRTLISNTAKYLGLTPSFHFDGAVVNGQPQRLRASDVGSLAPGSNTQVNNFVRRCRPENMWGIPERIARFMSLFDRDDLFLQQAREDVDIDEAFTRYSQYLLSSYQYNVAFAPTHYMVGDELIPGTGQTDSRYGSRTWQEMWEAEYARQDSTYLYTRFLLYDDSFRLISKSINRPRYVKEDSGEPELLETDKTWEDRFFPQDSEYSPTTLHEPGRAGTHPLYSGNLHTRRTQIFGNSSSVYSTAVGADNVVLYSSDGKLPPIILNINADASTADPTDMRIFYHREMFGGVKLQSYLSKDEVRSIKSSTFFRGQSGFVVTDADFTGDRAGQTLHTQESIRFRLPVLGWQGLPREASGKVFSNNKSPFFNPGITRGLFFEGIRTPTGNRLIDTNNFQYQLAASRTTSDANNLIACEGEDVTGFRTTLGGRMLAALNTQNVDISNRLAIPIEVGFRVVGSTSSLILTEQVRSSARSAFDVVHRIQNIRYIRSGRQEGRTPTNESLRTQVHATSPEEGNVPTYGYTLFIQSPFDSSVARFSYGNGGSTGVVTYGSSGQYPKTQQQIDQIYSRVYLNALMGVTQDFINSVLYLQSRLVISSFKEFPNLIVYSKRLDTQPIEFVGIRIFTEVAARTETTDTNFGAVISIVTREGLTIRWLQAQDDLKLRVGTDDRVISYDILDPDETGTLGDSIPSSLEPPQVLYDNEYFLSENGDTLYYNRYDRNYFSRRYLDVTQQLRPDFIGNIGKFAVDPANGLVFIATANHLLIAEVVQTRDTLGFFPIDLGGSPLSFDIERGVIYMSTGSKIVQWNPSSDIPYNISKKPYLLLRHPNSYKILSADIPKTAKPTCSDMEVHGILPVSYTHLTLPTICSV